MGGHGGLNILPQKRWNVYNFDNREKVRKDEEAAAKEEQLKREQSRRRDTEFRLQKLREARGLEPLSSSSTTQAASESLPESKSNNHMNLFEGIKIFDPVGIEGDEKMKGSKRMRKEVAAAAPKVILPEDEKYRLGYGVAGKGVKLPWYMAKRNEDDSKAKDAGDDDQSDMVCKRSRGKKSLEELRNERMKREKKEKERERALLLENGRHVGSASNNRGNARR